MMPRSASSASFCSFAWAPRIRVGGFTLLEMLVASMVFLVGFTSVYSLYLAGTKFRGESDQVLRLTMASNNLIARLRMQVRGADSPTAFLGDGNPTTPNAAAFDLSDTRSIILTPLPENPSVLYTVYKATDARGAPLPNSSVRLHYAVISSGTSYLGRTDPLTLSDIAQNNRLSVVKGALTEQNDDVRKQVRLMTSNQRQAYLTLEESATVEKTLHLLRSRNQAMLDRAIILRRP